MRLRFTITVGIVMGLVGMVAGISDAAPHGAFVTPTVQMSYYDDHQDAIVIADSSSEAEATSMQINYAPGLASLKPRVFPAIYTVDGAAAPGQLPVLGAEPGERTYSPIWREVTVTWSMGVTPVRLTSDTQIDQAEIAGDLSLTRTKVLLNAPVIATSATDPASVSPPEVFMTFYDGHQDGMLATDVSSKAQASAESINYSANLASLDPSHFPEIYIVRGRMATGQLQILGSEPGESSYSPLWRETIVRWRRGVTPRVIKSDTRIDALIEAGKLTEHGTTVVLNCPVVNAADGSTGGGW